MKKILVTHSSLSCFMNCRKCYEYKYLRGIKPSEASRSLTFGSATHAFLERYFNEVKKEDFDSRFPEGRSEFIKDFMNDPLNVDVQELTKEEKCKLKAIAQRYIDVYEEIDSTAYKVKAVEYEFQMPATDAKGRKYNTIQVAGKIDGVLEDNECKLWILEHKTTSDKSDAYIGRISIDSQIAIYAQAIERKFKKPVAGAIYDIIYKPSIKMRSGETDEEFEKRLSESKTGKIKRKIEESEEEFHERCLEAVTNENFRREIIPFNEEGKREFRSYFISAAKDLQRCTAYYPNTGECTKYAGCPYLTLCKARGRLEGLEGIYTISKPHEELSTISDEFKRVF